MLSPSLFGLQQLDPMGIMPQMAPSMGMTSPTVPASPVQSFVWGGAGDRLSDADIAQRELLARQESAAGVSSAPVQSWAQGADRVAQALLGGLDQKAADKASAANVTANNAAIASLSQPGGGSEANIAALLTDGTLSDGAHEFAKMKLAAMNKAPPKPTAFQQLALDAGLTPGTPQWTAANAARLAVENDPTMTTSLPGGGMYMGPRSQLQATLQGGGGQPSTAGVAAPPATLPPDFNFGAPAPGGAAPQGAGGFPLYPAGFSRH